MEGALYFCHACGMRLNAQEVDVALARGESHVTTCCAKCAKAGKRVKNPAALEPAPPPAAIFDSHAGGDSTSPAAKLAPAAAPAEAPAVTPAPVTARSVSPPQGSRTTTRQTRSQAAPTTASRKGASITALGVAAAGAVIFLVALVFSIGSREPVATAEPEAPLQPAPSKPAASQPTPSPEAPATGFLSSLGKGAATQPSASTAPTASTAPAVAATPQPSGTSPSDDFAPIRDLLHYKTFAAARERLEYLDKRLALNAPTRPILESLRTQCQQGSQAVLDELLKGAEAKAQAGDFNGARLLLGPPRTQDLLPEHAERAEKALSKLRETADAAAKATQEKRDAENAALRANFEKDLPAADSLLAPKGGLLFAPGGGGKATWKEGKSLLHQPAGKAPYLDGTKKMLFEGGAFGMVTNEPIVIEYSASEDCEFKVTLNIDQFGGRSGTFRFPAGNLCAFQINPNEDSKLPGGKRGKATGRNINSLCLEPKGVKPGTFALFRISR